MGMLLEERHIQIIVLIKRLNIVNRFKILTKYHKKVKQLYIQNLIHHHNKRIKNLKIKIKSYLFNY